MPYFNCLHSEWYHYINGKRFKKLPDNIKNLITYRSLPMFIMMDGSFNQGKRGLRRLNPHTNFFTHTEVKLLQKILLEKYDIVSYLRYEKTSDPNRGCIIIIPGRYVLNLRKNLEPYIFPGLRYKLGIKA